VLCFYNHIGLDYFKRQYQEQKNKILNPIPCYIKLKGYTQNIIVQGYSPEPLTVKSLKKKDAFSPIY